MKNILQKLYYYSPYIPVIGIIIIHYNLRNNNRFCIEHFNHNFFLPLLIQATSFCLILYKLP